MAKRRLSMRNTREILRLKFEKHLSNREIATSCGISHTAVNEYVRRAGEAGLTWPLPEDLDDTALEQLLSTGEEKPPPARRSLPPMEHLYHELKRKGVTLHLLWDEYKQKCPEGYQYSFFCEHYRRWLRTQEVSLRQHHRAGEKLFVDYAGQTIPIHDPSTGTITQAQIFIACLGASSYTYAEATLSQSLPDWIQAHVNTFEFLGGVPEILVPDNLKAGVKSPCRYEPDLNPTYQELAEHYGCVVIPTRIRKPKDKAKAEAAVMVVERWILAALRNHTFFSLGELNQTIREKLAPLNNRPFQKLATTRRGLFETIDKPALKPLPSCRYEYAQWKKATVNIDYHIEIDHHYYSVPYQLVRKQVEVRLATHTVEVLFKHRRIASHQRSYKRGGFTTLPEHMPEAHRRYLEWTPSRIIKWAGEIGPYTQTLVTEILNSRPHPQQGYRASLGIIRLSKRYSNPRLEAACARAVAIRAFSYKSVESMLKKGLDQQPLPVISHSPPLPLMLHENIRGNNYYHTQEEEDHA